MKLTILTQYYPPEIGAPQKRLSELAVCLTARGHEVTVLTAMPNYPQGRIYPGYGNMLRREKVDGIKIIRTWIYPTQSARMIRRLTNYFSFVFSSAIIGSLALGRSDFLMVESPPLFLGLSGYWVSRLKRTRLIFNVSDLWPESAVQLGVVRSGSLSHRLGLSLETFCYRKSWLITGQSMSILASIRERFPGYATFHLSNGVDTGKFAPDKWTSEARAEIASSDECVVLYTGLHGIAQGLDQLLAAAQRLNGHSGLHFVLVGDGPEKKMLMASTRELGLSNVRFFDPRPADRIPALVASADIVLVPLKMFIPGAVPSKLYEAMASGRPVVLIAEGEAADIVQRHRAGLVVKPGDIGALVEALRTLYKDPALRRHLGNNGRQAAVEFYDREKIVLAFEKYLLERL